MPFCDSKFSYKRKENKICEITDNKVYQDSSRFTVIKMGIPSLLFVYFPSFQVI